MKYLSNNFICLFSLYLTVFGSVAHAGNQTAGSSGVESGSNTPQKPEATINSGANESQGKNGFAQAMNYVVGGAEIVGGGFMIKSGVAPCPLACNWGLIAGGTMLVMMGTTNLAQGDEHGNSANTAAYTGFQTNGFGGLNTPQSSDPYVKAALEDPNFKAIKPTLAKLEKDGILNLKEGTVKINGKTYKKSDFQSAASMAAAGFSKGMIDKALATNAEEEKKALAKLQKIKVGSATAENGYDEGGGGSAGFAATGPTGDGLGGADYSGAISSGAGYGANGRDPAAFQGMSKMFNGEPIGVSADSIFEMVSRRFKLKDSQDSFFGPLDLPLQN